MKQDLPAHASTRLQMGVCPHRYQVASIQFSCISTVNALVSRNTPPRLTSDVPPASIAGSSRSAAPADSAISDSCAAGGAPDRRSASPQSWPLPCRIAFYRAPPTFSARPPSPVGLRRSSAGHRSKRSSLGQAFAESVRSSTAWPPPELPRRSPPATKR